VSRGSYPVGVGRKSEAEDTRAKATRLREQEKRAERKRSLLIVGGAGVIAVGLIAGAVVMVQKERGLSDPTAIEGLVTRQVEAGTHTDQPVDYPESPPLGGPHRGAWLNCGVYDEPQEDELAVHSLEHGAVWVAYRPDLPASDVDKLARRANGEPYLLVSPYPGLDSPIVATAWGNQVAVDGVNDERLERFIRTFANGPQTPEPGAICFNGVDGPGLRQ
jgi:hypothetical protein